MTTTSVATANAILNRVAVECGLDPAPDPYASSAKHFVQMRYLLQTAGEELAFLYDWEFLKEDFQVTTSSLDTGEYALPSDFLSMLNQTGWDRTNNVPLIGPLSAQQWTYLKGRDLVGYTIYASFRISDGVFNLLPVPVPNDLDINFEYKSRNWVIDGDTPAVHKADVATGSDLPIFDRTLMSRYLKVKWLDSKGFDTTKAQDDVNMVFGLITGGDKGAPILNAGYNSRGMPYLDAFYNTPDTGYGG